MKNKFLIRDYKTDGTPCLVEVSGDEWKKIIIQNTLLPIEERRYFIADCIVESDYIDRMYMEVSFEEFKKWNRENTRKRDQRKFKNLIIPKETHGCLSVRRKAKAILTLLRK